MKDNHSGSALRGARARVRGGLRGGRLQRRMHQAMPFVVGAGCIWLVAERCEGLALAQVWSSVQALPGTAWALAVTATALSFWAIGRYDAVLHHHFRTGHSPQEAAMAGRAAIAVGQSVGFGLLTGALVRWKWFEPHTRLWDAARLTFAVTVLFLLCWSVVTLTALAVVPVLPGGWLWAVAALGLGVALMSFSLFQPASRRLGFRWPSLRALLRLLALTIFDTVFAALALWVLLPGAVEIGFGLLFAVYLLALGAALITGTPGGLGPFEVTLLTFLPQVAEADLLAACVAFRLVYYALPALLAGAGVVWRHTHPLPPHPEIPDRGEKNAVRTHPNAELQLAHQPGKSVIWSAADHAGWVAETADQSLIALFDPLGEAPATDRLAHLANAARRADLLPMIYKCDGRMAAAARAAGWQVAAIAEDAVLDPVRFDLASRARRQARRKLRKADQGGVHVSRASGALPIGQMAEVARDWALASGGERGFSMSRFASAPLDRQAVFLAWSGTRLVAFVSFHVSTTGWALDLVRHRSDAPDGTMHALILAALQAARSAQVSRFSLASVPVRPRTGSDVAARMQRKMVEKLGGAGLRQFKASFGPRWERRYMAAPTRGALLAGVWDVLARVQPRHLPTSDGPIAESGAGRSPRAAHDEHEYYEIA